MRHVPLLIAMYGGIENALGEEKRRTSSEWGKYKFAGQHFGRTLLTAILDAIQDRLAKSGRTSVEKFNRVMLLACNKYSGNSDRSYKSREIIGYGYVMKDKWGQIQPSVDISNVEGAVFAETRKAMKAEPFSWIDTKKVDLWEFWEIASMRQKYSSLSTKNCSWCGSHVMPGQFWMINGYGRRRSGNNYVDTIHCKSPSCRHIDWLQSVPAARGGIKLTRQESMTKSDDQRTILLVAKYLKTKAKAANTRKAK